MSTLIGGLAGIAIGIAIVTTFYLIRERYLIRQNNKRTERLYREFDKNIKENT